MPTVTPQPVKQSEKAEVMLRADLDRLMLRAIVPERARVLAQPADTLALEWEKFKGRWKSD